jgi:protein Tex
MVLEGVVTNVTNFGAFVDVGVHQDGLVHVSELSSRFIKDPNEAVKVGQIVKVKVLTADAKTKRISLSIKALQQSDLPKVKRGAPEQRRQPLSGRTQAPKQDVKQPTKTSLDDKLAALNNRFRTR